MWQHLSIATALWICQNIFFRFSSPKNEVRLIWSCVLWSEKYGILWSQNLIQTPTSPCWSHISFSYSCPIHAEALFFNQLLDRSLDYHLQIPYHGYNVSWHRRLVAIQFRNVLWTRLSQKYSFSLAGTGHITDWDSKQASTSWFDPKSIFNFCLELHKTKRYINYQKMKKKTEKEEKKICWRAVILIYIFVVSWLFGW